MQKEHSHNVTKTKMENSTDDRDDGNYEKQCHNHCSKMINNHESTVELNQKNDKNIPVDDNIDGKEQPIIINIP